MPRHSDTGGKGQRQGGGRISHGRVGLGSKTVPPPIPQIPRAQRRLWIEEEPLVSGIAFPVIDQSQLLGRIQEAVASHVPITPLKSLFAIAISQRETHDAQTVANQLGKRFLETILGKVNRMHEVHQGQPSGTIALGAPFIIDNPTSWVDGESRLLAYCLRPPHRDDRTPAVHSRNVVREAMARLVKPAPLSLISTLDERQCFLPVGFINGGPAGEAQVNLALSGISGEALGLGTVALGPIQVYSVADTPSFTRPTEAS